MILFVLFSCEKEKDIDTEKPNIDITFSEAFPQNCDTLYFGEAFELKAIFTDNMELGSYSISVHHNFDQHSHSTEVKACNLDDKKEPVNPFVFIEEYKIPEGLNEYNPGLRISVPANNGNGSFDEGDYHFMIKLTDKVGWSALTGISLKMKYR